MSKREWILVIALALLLGLVVYQGQQVERSLDRIGHQLDAQEQARIDLLEARIVALEKTQARLRARLENE